MPKFFKHNNRLLFIEIIIIKSKKITIMLLCLYTYLISTQHFIVSLGGGFHDEEMHQKQKDYNIAIMFVIQIICIFLHI